MTRALPILLALAACSSDPTKATFSENVGEAFALCNPAEIRFLSAKHNFMLAFDACGSNNFTHYAWSPDGTHLYFQLTMTSHVMDAEAADKRTLTIPTESAIGPAAWLTSTRLAVPVGPTTDDGPPRIALFDIGNMVDTSLAYRDLSGYADPADLNVGSSSSELLFTATHDGRRDVFKMDVDDGSITPAFPWTATLTRPIETFTYTPQVDAAAIGGGGSVTLYQGADGSELGSWQRARRGVLHKDGRWLALEFDGDPISIFYQRTWDELSENVRERELARMKKFEERLPPEYPREVEPPTISMVDRTTGDRWVFTGFLGHEFQWYQPVDYYAAVILWGYEGKQLNSNVLLGNLADRLSSMGKGEEMLGVERWKDTPTEAEPTPTDPAQAPADPDPG